MLEAAIAALEPVLAADGIVVRAQPVVAGEPALATA